MIKRYIFIFSFLTCIVNITHGIFQPIKEAAILEIAGIAVSGTLATLFSDRKIDERTILQCIFFPTGGLLAYHYRDKLIGNTTAKLFIGAACAATTGILARLLFIETESKKNSPASSGSKLKSSPLFTYAWTGIISAAATGIGLAAVLAAHKWLPQYMN